MYQMESTPTLWHLHCITVIALATCSMSGAKGTHGNDTDRLALLEFKASIIDPLGGLSSWNSSHHFCQWYGVSCGRKHHRVTRLVLRSQDLLGTISPHIGNLSLLRALNIENNSFHSTSPLEVGRLSRLSTLYLSNNSLSGPVPASLSNCSNLVYIKLSNNMLQGKVLANLSYLSKLRKLYLQTNAFNGEIPLSLGNLLSLELLDLSENKLQGRIPETLGNLRNLKHLDLGFNNLVGDLPSSITNTSSMESLYLSFNHLAGPLPLELGITLSNLQSLSVDYNQFFGPIPKSISNMSKLFAFQIGFNNFKGNVPSFQLMSNLYWFSASNNHLGNRKANDLDFLCSLTNSTNLHHLYLGQNDFREAMPKCIGNLSITLHTMVLQKNALSGTLPSSIGNLINLEVLSFSANDISGVIPPEIRYLINLMKLYLALCKFTGEILHTLGNLSMLTHLQLAENNLAGAVPLSLGKCQRLLLLDLAGNRLTGPIPSEVLSLSSLSIYADFSQNNLSGELPLEIRNLKTLAMLDVQGNKLSGEIPSSLGGCMSLEYLYMQENMFTGPIPSALRSLKGLQELNLSHNGLSGSIPEFMKDIRLNSLDLSFNNFEGKMPTEGVFANISAVSVLGNHKLCGGPPEYRLPKCKSTGRSKDGRARYVSIYMVSGILATILVLSSLYFLWHKKQRTARKAASSCTSDDRFPKVSYQDLLRATDGFSSANLIGTGSFGSVFRGILALDGTTTAVKVLNLNRHGASKSFMAECEALRNISHRNLVKVLTACSGSDYQGNDFKALVYEFMVNGSLEEWLHPQAETSAERGVMPRQLSLVQRVTIATDVACALEYLHHQCETPIVHCDLKPSNVLIDGGMTAHLGDFGLVRFMPDVTRELISDQTSSIGVKGSVGYIAPEYAAGVEVSTAGDVYSYGILLLEIFTGKRPTDGMFIDGLNLHSFAETAFPERVLKLIDHVLVEEMQTEDSARAHRRTRRSHERFLKIQECLVSVVGIGLACSSKVPRDRMSMSDVAAALQPIQKKLHGI